MKGVSNSTKYIELPMEVWYSTRESNYTRNGWVSPTRKEFISPKEASTFYQNLIASGEVVKAELRGRVRTVATYYENKRYIMEDREHVFAKFDR